METKKVNINQFKGNDCGKIGKAVEMSITGKAEIAKAGKADWRYLRKCFEIKTGASELGNAGDQLCKGSSRVLYIPVPVVDSDGMVDVTSSEGFVLSRNNFLTALAQAGALREKTSSHGVRKITIQTFWNTKRNAPHGKLYERILGSMYQYCDMTLQEFLEQA